MQNPFISALLFNDENKIKLFSKIVALEIRNELENFHVKHLTDAQMEELNPLIRNAVYNSLFGLANMEKHENCLQTVGWLLNNIPEYWEEPVLNNYMEKAYQEILNRKIKFHDRFLEEQYELNNIRYIPSLALVQLPMLHEYNDINEGKQNKHKAKIVRALKKEGYEYDYMLDGYKKPLK